MTLVTFAFHSWLNTLVERTSTVMTTSHCWFTPVYRYLNVHHPYQINSALLTSLLRNEVFVAFFSISWKKRECATRYGRVLEFLHFICKFKWDQMKPDHRCAKMWNTTVWVIFRYKVRLLCKKYYLQNRIVLLNCIIGE